MINLKNTNVVLTGATGGIGNSILDKLTKIQQQKDLPKRLVLSLMDTIDSIKEE